MKAAAGKPAAKDRSGVPAAASSAAGPESDASLSAWASKVAPDANTGTLVRIHTLALEALAERDSKKLAEVLSPRVSLVGPLGEWASGREAVARKWPETMQCKGAPKARVYGGVASSISPGVELLTVKTSANGECDSPNSGDRFQTAVYVREGGSWKVAFIFDSIAG